MYKQIFMATAMILAGHGVSHAQSQNAPPDYPGHAWSSNGILSPIEDNNFVSESYAEQGIHRFHLDDRTTFGPYVSAGLTFDTEGYDWNNKVRAAVGVKLQHVVSKNGVVAFRAGFATEHRFKSDIDRTQPFVQGEYWFGWGGDDHRYPGSSWGVLSYNLPAEEDNVLAAAYVQQGYRIHQGKGWSLVPFIEATVSTDTKDYDWNNYIRGAAGMKAAINGCSCDIKVGYALEERFKSNRTKGGFIASINFWVPWNLKK